MIERGGVTSSDVIALTADRPRREVGAGTALLAAGAAHEALYVLETGRLRIEVDGQVLAAVSEPGSVVGEISMLLGVPVTADVVADVDSVVRSIDDADQLFVDVPAFARYLATTLARRLHRITGYLGDLERQFAGQGVTLELVPTVLDDLLRDGSGDLDPGSDREAEAPY